MLSSPLLWAELFVLPNLHADGVFCCCGKVKTILVSQPFTRTVAQTCALTDTCWQSWVLQAKPQDPACLCPDLLVSMPGALTTSPLTLTE